MEPVGVYKTLLNQCVYIFITPFITLFQANKKNRKLMPAVSVCIINLFFLFEFFYFGYLSVIVIKPSGSTVNAGFSSKRPSGRSRYQPSLYLMKVSDFMSPLTESQ